MGSKRSQRIDEFITRAILTCRYDRLLHHSEPGSQGRENYMRLYLTRERNLRQLAHELFDEQPVEESAETHQGGVQNVYRQLEELMAFVNREIEGARSSDERDKDFIFGMNEVWEHLASSHRYLRHLWGDAGDEDE